MKTQDWLKIGLTFLNGFAGAIAAFPGPEVDALARLVCAALVIACGATLLLVNPPGRVSDLENLTPKQKRQLVAAVKSEMLATRADPPGPSHG